MNLNHLLELRTVLEGVRDKDFEMGYWGVMYVTKYKKILPSREDPCGTKACALGHYILHKKNDPDMELLFTTNGLPDYGYAATHFGILISESHYLFDPSRYRDFEAETERDEKISVEEVISRIDKLTGGSSE